MRTLCGALGVGWAIGVGGRSGTIKVAYRRYIRRRVQLSSALCWSESGASLRDEKSFLFHVLLGFFCFLVFCLTVGHPAGTNRRSGPDHLFEWSGRNKIAPTVRLRGGENTDRHYQINLIRNLLSVLLILRNRITCINYL